jgi:hypothetical protein
MFTVSDANLSCYASKGSVGLEVGDSTASSPMIIHRPLPEEVSVQAFKKVLDGPSQKEREEEEAKKKKFQVRSSLPLFKATSNPLQSPSGLSNYMTEDHDPNTSQVSGNLMVVVKQNPTAPNFLCALVCRGRLAQWKNFGLRNERTRVLLPTKARDFRA